MHIGRLSKCALLLCLALVAGCAKIPSYRYKITVEVDTPQGLRTGSSVIEITGRREPKLPGMQGYHIYLTGEAVAVDLPNGQTLYALLVGESTSSPVPYDLPRQLLTLEERRSTAMPDYGKILGQSNRLSVLPRPAYPLLVSFDRPVSPGTMRSVDPEHLSLLSPGSNLHRITISTSRDARTKQIVKRLPWLEKDFRSNVKAPSGVVFTLGRTAFIR
jgi:hypothetical protein